MDQQHADAFAAAWIAAWNSRDLERILAHYADDVEVTSPLVRDVTGADRDTVVGKAALRAYWGPALTRFPDLQFRLFAALPGVHSAVLHYRSIRNLEAAEYMEFDASGRVKRVVAHYTPLRPA